MSLRDQLKPDLVNTFMNVGEFADEREFRINDGHGGFKVFKAKVGWDEEAASQQPVVTRLGVYQGDVILQIEHKNLPRVPVAGELIYSPANKPWEVLKVTDQIYMYVIALAATRSQPGHYGNN